MSLGSAQFSAAPNHPPKPSQRTQTQTGPSFVLSLSLGARPFPSLSPLDNTTHYTRARPPMIIASKFRQRPGAETRSPTRANPRAKLVSRRSGWRKDGARVGQLRWFCHAAARFGRLRRSPASSRRTNERTKMVFRIAKCARHGGLSEGLRGWWCSSLERVARAFHSNEAQRKCKRAKREPNPAEESRPGEGRWKRWVPSPGPKRMTR